MREDRIGSAQPRERRGKGQSVQDVDCGLYTAAGVVLVVPACQFGVVSFFLSWLLVVVVARIFHCQVSLSVSSYSYGVQAVQ